MVTLTLSQVKALKPCSGRWNFVSAALPADTAISAQQARDAGCTFNDMVWLASVLARTDKAIERRVRHWLADCATRVLHIYERDYPTDMRVRDAITAARDFADDRIRAAARAAARDAAWAAAGAAAGAAARAAAWAAARAAARDAAGVAARVAAGVAARAAAWDAEEQWQFDRLVAWLSENEPEPLALPDRVEVAA